jgi:hypothetical protein
MTRQQFALRPLYKGLRGVRARRDGGGRRVHDDGGAQELLGLDQSHLRTTAAMVRFWTLVLAAYTLLEEESVTSSAVRMSTVHAGIQTLQARCTGRRDREACVRKAPRAAPTARLVGALCLCAPSL